eukprot:TRINITY_DN13616_c0_g2_i1.p1 TRINITY_DN13616_c0_g2~~TRINITY_DN13616_c0_g2_i1.p1  ORF type:complete len:673 (-),score=189.36 TRINITY_DN13616_c0_g2_i1:13-2031(-)
MEISDIAKSGDGTLGNVGILPNAMFHCTECRQKFSSEKALMLHSHSFHGLKSEKGSVVAETGKHTDEAANAENEKPAMSTKTWMIEVDLDHQGDEDLPVDVLKGLAGEYQNQAVLEEEHDPVRTYAFEQVFGERDRSRCYYQKGGPWALYYDEGIFPYYQTGWWLAEAANPEYAGALLWATGGPDAVPSEGWKWRGRIGIYYYDMPISATAETSEPQVDIESMYEAKLKELVERHTATLKEQQENWQSQLAQMHLEASQIASDNAARIKELEEQNLQLKELQHRQIVEKEEKEAALAQARLGASQIASDNAARIKQLEEQNSQLKELQHRHSVEMEEKEAAWHSKLANAQCEASKSASDRVLQHEEQLQSLKDFHASEMQALHTQHSNYVATRVQELELALQEMQQHRQDALAKHQDSERRNEDLSRQLQQADADWQAKLHQETRQLEQDLQQQLQQELQQSDADWQEKLRQEAELHKQALEQAESAWQNKLVAFELEAQRMLDEKATDCNEFEKICLERSEELTECMDRCQSMHQHTQDLQKRVAELEDEVEKLKSQLGEQDDTTCPSCGNLYAPDAIFCRKCGQKRRMSEQQVQLAMSVMTVPKVARPSIPQTVPNLGQSGVSLHSPNASYVHARPGGVQTPGTQGVMVPPQVVNRIVVSQASSVVVPRQ